MTPTYKYVPWFNSEEWQTVFELLFSPNSDVDSKRKALEILLLWKARCPILPTGIESTLGLLEVELSSQNKSSTKNDRILRLMYSSALMRFINHALDDEQTRGKTLLRAGPMMNIPEWIVNLRHEVAHGHTLPALTLIKNASHYALNWLFETYWVQQNNIIKNYTLQKYPEDVLEQNLTVLITNYNLLTIFSQSVFKINTLNDIPDDEMKQSVFEFVSEYIVKSTVGLHWEMNVKSLTNKVLKEIKNLFNNSRNENKINYIVKILTAEESLFMATDITESKTLFGKDNDLPEWLVLAFESLLTFLHTRSAIGALVDELLYVVRRTGEEEKRRLRAAQWIKEICRGLYKSILFAEIADIFSVGESAKKSKIRENQILFLTHRHPNQKCGLTLDLSSPVPETLTDKNVVYENLKKYNQFINVYTKEYLHLSSNNKNNSSINGIVDLVDIMSPHNVATNDSPSTTVYTVTDLENECSDEMDLDNNNDKKINDSTSGIFLSSKWKMASSEFDWKNCPFGVLPWQLNCTSNPTFDGIEISV